MLGWLRKLTQNPASARSVRGTGMGAANTRTATAATDSSPPSATAPRSMTAWLLQCAQLAPNSTPSAHEEALVVALQRMQDAPKLPESLIPRASAVLPQLLRTLRQEAPSRLEWVEKVSKDQLLMAEVLRMAHSAHYRTREPVQSLDGALSLIGQQGLKAAIARVVLKPVLTSDNSLLTGRASHRAWIANEAIGTRCAAHLRAQGLDWFEGFLAGTLWGVGRTAVLRTLDLAQLDLPAPWTPALDTLLDAHAHRLFGRLVAGWDMTPLLNEAALEFMHQPAPQHPLCVALLAAEREFLDTQAL